MFRNALITKITSTRNFSKKSRAHRQYENFCVSLRKAFLSRSPKCLVRVAPGSGHIFAAPRRGQKRPTRLPPELMAGSEPFERHSTAIICAISEHTRLILAACDVTWRLNELGFLHHFVPISGTGQEIGKISLSFHSYCCATLNHPSCLLSDLCRHRQLNLC